MSPIPPIQPVAGAEGGSAGPSGVLLSGASFPQLLMQGVERVESEIARSTALATAFALDDTIPTHQVTVALEQARLSLELLLQVRTHLLEGYQEIMRMQI